MSNVETENNPSEKLDFMPASAKKSKAKKTIGIFLILILAGCGYWIYKSMQPAETSYLTQSVTRGNLVNSVEGTGTVVPLREADLSFKSDTVVKAINIEAGNTVTKGQILAVQDDVDFRSAVDQAQSSYQQSVFKQEQSAMNLSKARKTYAQQEALYKNGAVSQADFETARDDLRSTEINLELSKAQTMASKSNLVSAQENLENANLKAPFAGLVTTVNGVVGTSTSGTFAHLISNELKIEAMVNEADIGSVKVGQEVQFTVTAYPNKTFRGAVQRITQQASTTSSVQQYQVDIALDNSENLLLSGMSVTAKIIASQRQNAVLVPLLALTYAQTYLKENPTAVSESADQRTKTGNASSDKTTADSSSNKTGQRRPPWMRDSSSSSGFPGTNNGTMPRPRNWENNGTSNAYSFDSNGISKTAKSQAGPQKSDKESTRVTKSVVVMENDKPVVKTITIGIDDSQNAEVLSGLSAGEKVIIGKYNENSSASDSNTNSGSYSNSNSRNRNNSMMGPGGTGGPPM